MSKRVIDLAALTSPIDTDLVYVVRPTATVAGDFDRKLTFAALKAYVSSSVGSDFIRTDGTSVTTAPIVFAQGITSNAAITLNHDLVMMDATNCTIKLRGGIQLYYASTAETNYTVIDSASSGGVFRWNQSGQERGEFNVSDSQAMAVFTNSSAQRTWALLSDNRIGLQWNGLPTPPVGTQAYLLGIDATGAIIRGVSTGSYITIDTSQTGLTGNKTTSGLWTFDNGIEGRATGGFDYFGTAAQWARRAYSSLLVNANDGVTTGTPAGTGQYGYHFVFGKRNQLNGTFGIYADMFAANYYFQAQPDGSNMPTWHRIAIENQAVQFGSVTSTNGLSVTSGTTDIYSTLRLRSVPMGTQAYLLAVDATGAVVQGTATGIASSGFTQLSLPWGIGNGTTWATSAYGIIIDGSLTHSLWMKGNVRIEQSTTEAISLFKPTAVAGQEVCMTYEMWDTLGGDAEYARTCGEIVNGTAGAYSGRLNFYTASGGALVKRGYWSESGALVGLGSASFSGNTTSTTTTTKGTIGSYDWAIQSSAGVDRWIWRKSNAESTGNVGSDLELWARDDAGGAIGAVMTITRASGGSIILARPTNITNTTASTSTTTGALVVGGGGAFGGSIYAGGIGRFGGGAAAAIGSFDPTISAGTASNPCYGLYSSDGTKNIRWVQGVETSSGKLVQDVVYATGFAGYEWRVATTALVTISTGGDFSVLVGRSNFRTVTATATGEPINIGSGTTTTSPSTNNAGAVWMNATNGLQFCSTAGTARTVATLDTAQTFNSVKTFSSTPVISSTTASTTAGALYKRTGYGHVGYEAGHAQEFLSTIYTGSSAASLTNNAAATDVGGTALFGSRTLSTSVFQVGQRLKYRAKVQYTNTAANTLTLELRWGSTSGAVLATITSTRVNAGVEVFDVDFEGIALAAPGATVSTAWTANVSGNTTVQRDTAVTTTPTSQSLATSTATALVLTAKWSTALTTSTLTVMSNEINLE